MSDKPTLSTLKMSLTEVTCNILVKGTNGIEYGYISPGLNPDGYFANFQPDKAGALAVSFSYSATACSRLDLQVSDGPSAFPFLGGIEYSKSNIEAYRARAIPLGLTCATPPSGAPRVSSNDNSSSTRSTTGPEPRYLESSIWRYNPATQALTAQWINPDGDEPETTIVLADHSSYYPRRRLALTSDVDGMKQFTGEDGSVDAVTFTCVLALPDVICNILVRGANGVAYGYLSPVLNADGWYGNFQPDQAGALTVSFSYTATERSRLNLQVSNSPKAFPFLGGSLPLARAIPLGLTCATPPSGAPRVFSDKNSFSAAAAAGAGGPQYLGSPIWHYNPATQALTAQWINPKGDEPETTIILSAHSYYYTRQRLALAGDVDGVRRYLGERGPVDVVTFTCVPIQNGPV
ncbi:hypothetical protein K438DRAFT_1765480 [Mycena galopus ATCC 62051]|nr:hypothetical protein K438DRAFT_1765480 [Mycena galopus ATCC 62051]